MLHRRIFINYRLNFRVQNLLKVEVVAHCTGSNILPADREVAGNQQNSQAKVCRAPMSWQGLPRSVTIL